MTQKYLCKNHNNNTNCRGEVCYNTYHYGGGLCKSCATKKRTKGKNNPNYIDGRTSAQKCIGCGKTIDMRCEYCWDCFQNSIKVPKKLCMDCGKEIKGYKAKRCHSCANSGQLNSMFGKHCIHTEETKKIISQKNLGNYHTKETRKKISLGHGGTGIPYENADYPEKFNSELKYKIRKRDNFTCQMSGITETEHLKKYGKKLDVHHIDYDKQNCKKDNLITLTHLWNIKVNGNRKYWTKYFKGII